ncbi:MAG: exo-beta-N-acetylmuramidase NamZ domain-containing protein, partial [Rhabdochlamydiaceae bacterium]
MNLVLIFIFACISVIAQSKIELGSDRLFENANLAHLTWKRVGILTNQTGLDNQLRSTLDRLIDNQGSYQIVALFCPEHGLKGVSFAGEKVID